MAIDFSLTNEQRKLQADTREFAENVLGPVVREADAEPDPLRGFQRTKEASSYAPIPTRAAPKGCRRSWWTAAPRASATSSSTRWRIA